MQIERHNGGAVRVYRLADGGAISVTKLPKPAACYYTPPIEPRLTFQVPREWAGTVLRKERMAQRGAS